MLVWLITGLGLLVLLILAFGAGVRYHRRQAIRPFADTYYQSLRYILNEQTDTSVDIFLRSLVVDDQTLDIHLALGSLMRRRGEVSKAIQIHEFLLRTDKLNPLQRHQAQLALACDFVSAGLLDRAENLLAELVDGRSRYTPEALHQLMLIYQREREWSKAIAVADQLTAHPGQLGDTELALMKSHYCCELAQQAIVAGQAGQARDFLGDAVRYYQQSVRASLLLAQLDTDAGNYTASLEGLRKIPQQDADFIRESLPLVKRCFQALGDVEGQRNYLYGLLARYPGSSLVLGLAELLEETEGEASAIDFMKAQLRLRPSIRILDRLLDAYLRQPGEHAKENLELLKLVVEKLLLEKPVYLCHKCGFNGHTLYWLCPSCKSWGAIKPIKGVAGE